MIVTTFQIFLENCGPPSKMEVNEGTLGTRLHRSAINDADDSISSFTSILKNTAEETIPKTSAVQKCFNKPWFKDPVKDRNRALKRFKREPLEGNLAEFVWHSKKASWRVMSPSWILKHHVNLYGIESVKSKEMIPVTLSIIYLSMIEKSRFMVTLLRHWQITFPIMVHLLSVQMPLHLIKRNLKRRQ